MTFTSKALSLIIKSECVNVNPACVAIILLSPHLPLSYDCWCINHQHLIDGIA